MKKKTSKIILISIITIAILFAVYYFVVKQTIFGSEGGLHLSVNSPGLYQYTGQFGQTKGGYAGQSYCGIDAPFYYGDYILASDSTIKTATHTYKITINQPQSQPYANPLYLAQVYQDNNLIDTLDFSSPTENPQSAGVKREYSELTAIFGLESTRSGDVNYCAPAPLMATVHQYEVNYPSDSITFSNLKIINKNDTSAQIQLTADVKYKPFLGNISLNIVNQLGTDSLITQTQQSLNLGSNTVNLIVPITPNTQNVNVVPKAILYSSTSDLTNLNGAKVFLNLKTVSNQYVTTPLVNSQDYQYYEAGEFKGTSFIVNFNDTTIPVVVVTSTTPVNQSVPSNQQNNLPSTTEDDTGKIKIIAYIVMTIIGILLIILFVKIIKRKGGD